MSEAPPRSTLGERVEVTMGRQRSPKHAVGDHLVPYLRAANVKDSELQLRDVLKMNFSPAEQEKFCLRPGDVLVTEGCGSLRRIGASARWNREINGPVAFQNTLLRLRAIDGVTDAGFVYHWARWAYQSGAFAEVASGTSIFHIGSKRAAAMPFPDIPLADQRRMTDLLSTVEAAVRSSYAAVAAARKLRRALLAETYRHAIEVAAKRVPLGNLARVTSGASWAKQDECDANEPGAIAALRVANMKDTGLDISDLCFIRPSAEALRKPVTHPSVMLVRTNTVERVGNAQFVPTAATGFVYSSFLILVTPEAPEDIELIGRFLQAPQSQSEMSSKASGSTAGLKNVPVTWLRRLEVPVLDEPRREALLMPIRAAEATLKALETRLGALVAFQSGLLDALMAGRQTLPDSYDRFLRLPTVGQSELVVM
jgi:hypothetical protein